MKSMVHRFAPLILALSIGVLFGVSIFSKENLLSTPLTWTTYTETAHEQTGYLAVLHSEQGTSSVYIAVDKPVTSTGLNLKEHWTFTIIDESVQWNPRVCAKTPSLTLPGGNMYMYDTRRTENGSYDSYFVRYDTNSETLSESPVAWGEFIGKTMFRTGQKPYFLEQKEDHLFLSTYDAAHSELRHVPLVKLRNHEKVTVSLGENEVPLIEIYDAKTLRSQTYTLSEEVLSKNNETTIARSVTYPDASHAIHDLGNGYSARYNLSNPYETSIMHGDTLVLEFSPEEKIYSYVIGSFTVP